MYYFWIQECVPFFIPSVTVDETIRVAFIFSRRSPVFYLSTSP